jgi:hypothetical protein
MHIQTDRALTPATPSVRYLQVRVSAPPAPARTGDPRPPVDVALVLDRSGSMGGSKFSMARTAVQHAIRLLAPTDALAVVCYDDRVDTLLARTAASVEAKALALDRLAVTDARGSTDLAAGWLQGAAQLAPVTPEARRRVLLLTDGLANCGVTEPAELEAAAQSLRAQGIITSTFGLGADFDEALLSRLATAGGGRFYFIEQATQIPDFFTSELGEALEVVARDATFEITSKDGVQCTLVNERPTEAIPGGIRVPLGDLVADQEVTFVVAVRIANPPALGAGVEVKCRLSDADGALFNQPMFVDWAVVPDADDAAQPVNQAVVRAFAEALTVQALAQALEANRQGHYDEARRILGEAIAHLQRLGESDEAVATLLAQLAADQDQLAHAMQPMALKRRYFANYTISASLCEDGKARRRPRVS